MSDTTLGPPMKPASAECVLAEVRRQVALSPTVAHCEARYVCAGTRSYGTVRVVGLGPVEEFDVSDARHDTMVASVSTLVAMAEQKLAEECGPEPCQVCKSFPLTCPIHGAENARRACEAEIAAFVRALRSC